MFAYFCRWVMYVVVHVCWLPAPASAASREIRAADEDSIKRIARILPRRDSSYQFAPVSLTRYFPPSAVPPAVLCQRQQRSLMILSAVTASCDVSLAAFYFAFLHFDSSKYSIYMTNWTAETRLVKMEPCSLKFTLGNSRKIRTAAKGSDGSHYIKWRRRNFLRKPRYI